MNVDSSVYVNFPIGLFRIVRISMTHPYMRLDLQQEQRHPSSEIFEWGNLQGLLGNSKYQDYGLNEYGVLRKVIQTFSTNEMPDIIKGVEPRANGYLTIHDHQFALFDGTNYYQFCRDYSGTTVLIIPIPAPKINRAHFYGPGRETKAYRTPTMNLPYALSDCTMGNVGEVLAPIDWFLKYVHQHAGEVADPFNRKKDNERDGFEQEYVIIKGGS